MLYFIRVISISKNAKKNDDVNVIILKWFIWRIVLISNINTSLVVLKKIMGLKKKKFKMMLKLKTKDNSQI